MCRIYGYFGGGPVSRDVLDQVGARLVHGGPDEQTVHVDALIPAALGANRLAIQGITDGHQPYQLPGLVCVFNGEIYNHRALRRELTAAGYHVDGDCDGNVLLPLYLRYGDGFVDRLEGMFAVAIVDRRYGEACLKLYNDHAGMKSLYWYRSRDGRRLCFASELGALAQFPDFPNRTDPLAIDQYLGGRAVWGPGTIYTDVRTMAPGTMVRFDLTGQLTTTTRAPLADLEPVWPRGELDLATAAELLDTTLHDELTRMCAADVPACVITSGGLDSSYLTALASRLQPNLHSFHVAYRGDWPADERDFANQVADHCGTQHHEVLLNPDEFPDTIDKFVRHLDQPNNAPHSLSTYALFQAIRETGFKVAITGDGADELFAGYARYGKAARDGSATWYRAYQESMAAITTRTLADLYQPDYLATVRQAGGFFADRSGDELARLVVEGRHDKLETLLRYDQDRRFPYYILRRVDHLSMAHAVEARIPFVQPAVVRLAHGLPASLKVAGDTVKAPIAQAASRWIPASVVRRPKQPFTLPITAMLRPGEALYDLVHDVLLAPNSRIADVVRADRVAELLHAQTHQPDAHASSALWTLLILERWLDIHHLP
jgi:asparagine synthase (glutamine-hydrolysing)